MDEVQYIVPPENDIPGNSNNHNNPKILPPKKPNKVLVWVKSHKILSIASMAMAGIIVLASVVMITDKQISIFGFQLNPLYDQANVLSPCSYSDLECLNSQQSIPSPGPGEETPLPPTNPPTNPPTTPGGQQASPAGFQITVRDNGCTDQERTSSVIGANSSGNVTDANAKDPDCASVNFNAGNVNGVPQNDSIYTNDFRLGVRVAESESNCTNQIDGSIKWTGWASDGGSTSPQAVGTATSNDPDCIWLHYETRPMPAGKGIRDVRIGIASGGNTQFTPWARAGGGASAFSSGGNIRPTTITIDAQTITTSTPPTTPPTTPTGISISGSIPNGIVGQQTTAVLSVTGSVQTPCTWTLVSINPAVNNATINASESSGPDGTFMATPTTAGTYQVAIRATCGGGQVANVTLPWVVNPITSGPGGERFSINGTFPAGVVGQDYATRLRTVGANTSNCTWTLVSVIPGVRGASISRVESDNNGSESSADYKATPTAVGLYKVTVSANCGASGTAQKVFDWVVGKTGTGGGGGSSNSCFDQTTLDKLSAIYRYWSPAYGDHLYTTNPNEKPNGYRFEGISGYVFAEQKPNTVPIYRSVQRQIGSHYYTTTNEDPTQYGYVDEGILGYAYASSVAGSAPWYRMHKGGDTSDYVHTLSEAERSAIKELGYADEGTVAYICGNSQPTELQPLFRLWGPADGDHFYTTNFSERDGLLTRNYFSEGITGYMYGVRKDGSAPLYRSYSHAIGDHLYTTSESEAHTPGYSYEGIMGYISQTDSDKTTPIYRLYSSAIGDHFYTTSSTEAASAIASGYLGEGIAGYLYLSQ